MFNILAKCPNTVWVLHHEKVVLGVALSCYVVLGSRVVLCCVELYCVYLKSIGNPGFGGGLGWFLEAVCSDSWVWRRSGEVWEVGSVAIPGFGGLGVGMGGRM